MSHLLTAQQRKARGWSVTEEDEGSEHSLQEDSDGGASSVMVPSHAAHAESSGVLAEQPTITLRRLCADLLGGTPEDYVLRRKNSLMELIENYVGTPSL